MAGLLLWVAASAGVSWALHTRRMHGYLSHRLEAAFGRPVEVGRFGFSLLGGPRLEANYVTVAEDPRFGHEYFLRADRLSARPRWGALVRGRFEFATLSFTRPSLNLVRAPNGRWNVEDWLPPPPRAPAASAVTSAKLYRIEIESGRINFKRGVDKHPFALVEVAGHLEQEGLGRWRLDLEARPLRAAVELQDTGTLRLHGRVAGTTTRLQPAELFLTWQEASLADVLRLARGQDYGIRGSFGVELSGRSVGPSPSPAAERSTGGLPGVPATLVPVEPAAGAQWTFALKVWATGIHRWDLPQRPGDPALSLRAEAQWWPEKARLDFTRSVLEAPRSSLEAMASVRWAPELHAQLSLSSHWIHFADLLAWYRAFRPGVASDATLEGGAALELALDGWPLRAKRATATGSGASFRTAGLRQTMHLDPWTISARGSRLELRPTTISFEESPAGRRAGSLGPTGHLRLEGALALGEQATLAGVSDWKLDLKLAGQSERVQDWLSALAVLGQPRYPGWGVEGQAAYRARWKGTVKPWRLQPEGVLELHNLRLRSHFVNQPVVVNTARVELRGDERRVTQLVAQGFGARWTGALFHRPDQMWEFDLRADRLDVGELDRWLGPRARPGLLQRLLPFAPGNAIAAGREGVLNRLQGRGHLQVDEFHLPPLVLRRLRGALDVVGRRLVLRQAQARFCGGTLKGALEAELLPQPAYQFQGQFERVRLDLLSADAASLRARFSGLTSGELELRAEGLGRAALLRSLSGRGALRAQGLALHGLDLGATVQETRLHGGTGWFAAAEAVFSISNGQIQTDRVRLANREEQFQLEGRVDFTRAVDLRVFQVQPETNRNSNPANGAVRLTGTLEALRVRALEAGPVLR